MAASWHHVGVSIGIGVGHASALASAMHRHWRRLISVNLRSAKLHLCESRSSRKKSFKKRPVCDFSWVLSSILLPVWKSHNLQLKASEFSRWLAAMWFLMLAAKKETWFKLWKKITSFQKKVLWQRFKMFRKKSFQRKCLSLSRTTLDSSQPNSGTALVSLVLRKNNN